MKIIYLTIFTMLVNNLLSLGQSSSWELQKQEDGIEVYTKKIEDSNYKAFKAEMTVLCPMKKAVSIIKDTDKAYKWLHNSKKSELLKKQDENLQYNYNITAMPFPFKDRDMIFKMMSEPSDKSYKINVEGVPEYLPKKNGITRMESAKGNWELKQNTDGTLFISYSMHVVPGGTLPSWLVNTKLTEVPFETLYKLRKILFKK